MPQPELELIGVSKTYQSWQGSRQGTTHALAAIDLALGREEFVAIVGQSGCGKTTLLRILAGLVRPSSGEVRTAGRSLWAGAANSQRTRCILAWLGA